MGDESGATAYKAAAKRRKLIYMGLAIIAFGVVGAIFGYWLDRGSFDLIRMMDAKAHVVIHLVVFTLVGLAVIGWAFLPPANNDDLNNDLWPPQSGRM